jgi:hypothetical protein
MAFIFGTVIYCEEAVSCTTVHVTICTFTKLFSMVQQPLVGQGLLTVEASRSHSDTPHSVGLLWTRDQADAETSTWQHTNTHNRQTSMSPAGFESAIPESERPQIYALYRVATGIGPHIISRAVVSIHKSSAPTPTPRFLKLRLLHKISICINLLKPSGNFTCHQV